MPLSLADVIALEELETKLRRMLPDMYREIYESVVPVSMGSAPLKYSADGKPAWDETWKTFCDLAMAGGPPHRGTLLQPASLDEIANAPEQYRDVASEI